MSWLSARLQRRFPTSFDLYWNNQWAYPGEALLQNYKDQDLLPELLEELQEELVKEEELLVEFQRAKSGLEHPA